MGVLDGKVAIVTGASKGIGKGEALALAKEGAKVAVVARTYDGEEGVVRTAHELEALGASCATDPMRRRRRRSGATAQWMRSSREWGTVDILVNNAQIIYAMHRCEDWTESEMRATWESGLLGSWAFMVACFPRMKEKGGRIINTCSTTGHGNVPGYVGYSCTKEAIRALTRNAAREWARYGINVNTISPTALSDIVVKTFPDEAERLQALLDGGQVVGRWGDAEMDVGRAVVFLAGPDSGLITGCTLSVDGGAAML